VKKTAIISLTCVLAVGTCTYRALNWLALGLLGEPTPGRLTTTRLAQVDSQDMSWSAFSDEVNYEGAYPFMDWSVDKVYLKPSRGSEMAEEILATDGGSPGLMPRLSWTSPRTLQIEVSDLGTTKLLREDYKDVHIVLISAQSPDNQPKEGGEMKP